MNLGKNYKLESDTLNVTLLERRVVKRETSRSKLGIGEEYWKPIAYFSSLRNALTYLMDREVCKTGLKDVKEILDKLNEVETVIRNAVRKERHDDVSK
jgi:hypothetical protein